MTVAPPFRLPGIHFAGAVLWLVAGGAGLVDDGQRRVVLGVALAYLGRKAEAIREGQRGVELVPVESDAQSGAYY